MVSVAMSCDYLFNVFVHTSNDKGAGHSPYTWLWHILSIKSAEHSERWVQHLLDKFVIPCSQASAMLATCLNRSAVLIVRGLSSCLFAMPFDSHTYTWFCSTTWAPEVIGLNLPMLSGSFLPCMVRGNEPRYEATCCCRKSRLSIQLKNTRGQLSNWNWRYNLWSLFTNQSIYLNMYPAVVLCLCLMLYTHNSVNLFQVTQVLLDTFPVWGICIVTRCLPTLISRPLWFQGGLWLIVVAWLSLKLQFNASFIVSTYTCFINFVYYLLILHSQNLHIYYYYLCTLCACQCCI